VLIRALPAIARHVPQARIVVAGHPFEPAEPLQELAQELGVAARIDWRLGFVPEAEVAALFERAALVVLPYRELESSGVLASALGHGRPAVVSDVGSLGSTVREFEAGRVVPPDDPDALAAACVELLSDATALARAAEGAREARAALTWDTAAAEHERVYEKVLAERL
jgi:glycosyltransferase involved in cell wall biosynthesis